MSRHTRLLLALVVVGNVVAALAPLRFDPPRFVHNRLERAAGAWRFRDPSLAASEAPPPWLDEVRRSHTFTVAVLARAVEADQSGPARILTVSDGLFERNLMLGQQGDDLIVRLRRPGADRNGMPALVVPDVLASGRWRELVVRASAGAVDVQVDGVSRVRRVLPPDAFAGWDPTFSVALGNEVGGQRAWVGDVASAVVTTPAGSDDLLAPGRLVVPERWWQTPDRLRSVLRVKLPADLAVALLHALAFAPIGYLVHRRRGGAAIGPTAAWVTVLSIAIESAKVLAATRHPSVLNLVAQVAGGVGGALLSARPFRARLRARR